MNSQIPLIKHKLICLPLEPYKERYSELLGGWETKAFSESFQVESIIPQDASQIVQLRSGRVLDQQQRPLYAMRQISELVSRADMDLGRIYFSDFYTPGLDALEYSGKKFRASAFLWAQTFDKYDFTQTMISWMRIWEVMGLEIYENIFVASSLLADLIITACPQASSKIHVVGLPYDSAAVQNLWDPQLVPKEPFDCVYASRWDLEKNPAFFLDLAIACPGIKFAICTGAPTLRGTDVVTINRLNGMLLSGRLKNVTLFQDCSKAQYYSILSECKTIINAGNQDWVSFTLLDALTMGCLPLYPNHRSFPETLNYDDRYLYRPFNLEDCAEKLRRLLISPKKEHQIADQVLGVHNKTLSRISEILAK